MLSCWDRNEQSDKSKGIEEFSIIRFIDRSILKNTQCVVQPYLFPLGYTARKTDT